MTPLVARIAVDSPAVGTNTSCTHNARIFRSHFCRIHYGSREITEDDMKFGHIHTGLARLF